MEQYGLECINHDNVVKKEAINPKEHKIQSMHVYKIAIVIKESTA